MPVSITSFQNPQQIEAVVSGPDGANRLFILTGIVQLMPNNPSKANGEMKETYAFAIGPTFKKQQFIRAIASAHLTNAGFNTAGPFPATAFWSIVSVDADWDDESGMVEVRVEVYVNANFPGSSATVFAVGYHVTILAQV